MLGYAVDVGLLFQRRYAGLLLLFIAASLLTFASTPAIAQQQAAVTLNLTAGFEGAYRIAEWFPVDINVTNDGPDIRGILRWTFPSQPENSAFEYPIDLPRGSHKRVRMNVFASGFARNGNVRLIVDGNVVAEQSAQLEAVDADRFLIGVISDDPALLNSLNSLQFPGTNGASVRHIDATSLPYQATALRSLNVLFLHNTDTNQLSSEQRAALGLWVQLGGQLIVSGGMDVAQTAAGVSNLLPVEVTDEITQGDLTSLINLAGLNSTTAPPTTAPINKVRLRPGAEPISNGSTTPGNPLIFRWGLGTGTIIFTAFDVAVLRSWTGEIDLWRHLFFQNDISSLGATTRQQHTNLLERVWHLPALDLPSVSMVLIFLLVYILAVGPVTYRVLRYLKRPEWAWFTLPVTMLGFAAVFYLVGFGLRGSSSQLNQVAVVQAVEGQPRGLATSFIGLFSPYRTRYTFDFGPDMLVSEVRAWSDNNSNVVPITTSDANVEARDVLIDVASIRTFVAESTVAVPLTVKSDLHTQGLRTQGEIRNLGGEDLKDALIVTGNSFQSIGTLAPGVVVQVDLSSDKDNFPSGVNIPQTGSFNRQELLSELFPQNSSSNVIDTHGTYLLAWRDLPVTQIQVNQQQVPQDGLTLYVIRLNG